MYIIIFIIILIFNVCFNIYEKYINYDTNKYSIIKDNVIEDIDNINDILNNGYIGYRLGDVVKGYFKKTEFDYFDYLQSHFKNSIANEYYLKTNGYENKSVLHEIIQSRSKNLKFKNINCLHIRLGDVVSDGNKPDLPNYNRLIYNLSLDKYEIIANKLKNEFDVNEITIIGGAHLKSSNLNESLKFINNVKNILLKYNIKVNIRLGNDPDEDFLIMCNSDLFVKTGGGFSRIIAEYVNKNGGIVIDLL